MAADYNVLYRCFREDSDGTGISKGLVPPALCQAACLFLSKNWAADGGFQETKNAKKQMLGYQEYDIVQDRENFDGVAQAKNTLILSRGQLQNLPALKPLLEVVETAHPYCIVTKSHALRYQTSTTTLFGIHRDNEPRSEGGSTPDAVITVSISLNDAPSSMRVCGKNVFHYNGQGCSATFVAGAFHESIEADLSAMKLVLFLSPKGKSK